MRSLIVIMVLFLSQVTFGTVSIQGVWNFDMSIGGVGETVQVIDNLYIQPGKTLTVLPGTTVEIYEDVQISVYGSFISKGTVENPISFDTKVENAKWSGFDFDSEDLATADSSIFEHCIMTNSSKTTEGGLFFIKNFSKIKLSDLQISYCESEIDSGAIYI